LKTNSSSFFQESIVKRIWKLFLRAHCLGQGNIIVIQSVVCYNFSVVNSGKSVFAEEACMKTIITIQHTQSVHHTNGMVGSWTDWELSDLGV